ncbi:MAG: hypothetical protein KGD63_11760 [Candidatus Lokiarchaeota archaeon]|nr:hypothetical protein [Candidatus Lokiarchaeota archaeon]
MKNISLILYKVENKEIIPVEEAPFESDKIYIIIEKHRRKRSKIWIWSGPDSNMLDKYFAGVSATRIKSKEKLYGASIEVVDSGNEPKQFPKISKDRIMKPIEEGEYYLSDDIIEKISKAEDIIIEEVHSEPIKIPKETDNMISIQKVTSILKELSLDLGKMREKINKFLSQI